MEEKRTIRIVPMTGDHLEALAELEKTCFSRPWSREMLKEELENDCAAFLVAEDPQNGEVLGYAGLLVTADEGYITNVAVFPAYRRQGLAGKILEVFIKFARAQQLAFLTLRCGPATRRPSPFMRASAFRRRAGGETIMTAPKRTRSF